MLKSYLDSLEDPKRPLIAPNYWFLKKLGLILPEHRLERAVCVIVPTIIALFVFSQYLELYITRSDLDQVLTNMRISMLSVVCVAKAFSLLVWQKDWLEIFDYVTEADKFERDTRDEMKGKILDKYTKYCRKVTYLYWGLLFITFLGTSGNPLFIYLSSETYREELRNGTKLFPHIFCSWMPFDKYHSPGCWVTVGWHVLCCAWGGSIMAAYDSNIMVMLVFFGGKLDLMQERCRQMFGSDGRGILDDEAEKAIREMHHMHATHMKYMKLQNSVLSPVMFLYVVMSSLMLCASLYQLTTSTNILQMLPMAQYLVFGIAQLINYCWHSNDVLIKNEQLTQGLFESQWWTATKRQRKSILLLMGQLNMSHIFTAGPFTNLTLSTFVTILKGSYSYYTLVRK